MVDHERKIAPACVGVDPPRQHPHKVARNSIERSFNKRRKRCNSNEAHSRFKTVAGELRAKLVSVGGCAGCGAHGPQGQAAAAVGGGARATHSNASTAGVEGAGGTRGQAAAAVGRRAWLRRPWAAAGPGRASRRRAERSSRRGRLAGGPPPTGAPSSPAPQQDQTTPGTPAGPQTQTQKRQSGPKPFGSGPPSMLSGDQ